MRILWSSFRTALSLLTFCFCALAQTPTGLTVKSATSSQVALTWSGTATSYTVQRAQVGGAFTNIATVSAASFTDTNVDPYNQFTYQISVTNSGNSNQVTVGPPPSGLSVAAPAPLVGSDPDTGYGDNAVLTLDGNGDPALAFFWEDPTHIERTTNEQLLFRSWNRSKAAWNPVVQVGVVGGPSGGVNSKYRDPIALTYDSTTGTFVIAVEDEGAHVRIYFSTDGSTWTLKRTITEKNVANAPSVAVFGGNLYLTYQSVNVGLRFLTGKITADPATWTIKTSPDVPGVYGPAEGLNAPVAVDSSGVPAVTYWNDDAASGYNRILLYWRPLSGAAPLIVLDSKGFQNDSLDVKLTFYKTNPRILTSIFRGDGPDGSSVHFSRSEDGGATWQTPVVISPDGNSSTDFPFSLAIDSKGNGAIEFGQNTGSGGTTCSNPKLARSSDLVHWTTCGLAPAKDIGEFAGFPNALNIAFQGNDKLYSLWWNVDTVANTGVVLYRERPDNQASGPVISNVLDAESARATVVPGEWVAIYGANLAGLSRTWADADFNKGQNLPTDLSGTSVKFNGIPAAVFYVSPTQLDVQVPSGVSGSVPVVVTANGSVSAAFTTTIVPNAPSFYVYPAGGKLYPAAVHVNGDLVGDPTAVATAKKVKPGETLIFFVNGLGTAPAGVIISGAIAYSSPMTFSLVGPGSSTASVNATVAFAGLVAAGEFQLNVVVPSGLAPGDYAMTITTQGQSSPGTVILPVTN